MLKVTHLNRAAERSGEAPRVAGSALLLHDERHVRRRAISLTDGRKVLVDLAEPIVLAAGDHLVLEDGSAVEILAAEEPLYEVLPRDRLHLVALAWHIGNRHLPAAIEDERILILRDHVIRAMLEGLGARVNEITAPFTPLRGAYDGGHGAAGHAHAHGGAHDHSHSHDHGHTHGHGHSHSHSHD